MIQLIYKKQLGWSSYPATESRLKRIRELNYRAKTQRASKISDAAEDISCTVSTMLPDGLASRPCLQMGQIHAPLAQAQLYMTDHYFI